MAFTPALSLWAVILHGLCPTAGWFAYGRAMLPISGGKTPPHPRGGLIARRLVGLLLFDFSVACNPVLASHIKLVLVSGFRSSVLVLSRGWWLMRQSRLPTRESWPRCGTAPRELKGRRNEAAKGKRRGNVRESGVCTQSFAALGV